MLIELYCGGVLIVGAGIAADHYVKTRGWPSLAKMKATAIAVIHYRENKRKAREQARHDDLIATMEKHRSQLNQKWDYPEGQRILSNVYGGEIIAGRGGGSGVKSGAGGYVTIVGGAGGAGGTTSFSSGGGVGSVSRSVFSGGDGVDALISHDNVGLALLKRINDRYHYAQAILQQSPTDIVEGVSTLALTWFNTAGAKQVGRLSVIYPDFQHMSAADVNVDNMFKQACVLIENSEPKPTAFDREAYERRHKEMEEKLLAMEAIVKAKTEARKTASVGPG